MCSRSLEAFYSLSGPHSKSHRGIHFLMLVLPSFYKFQYLIQSGR